MRGRAQELACSWVWGEDEERATVELQPGELAFVASGGAETFTLHAFEE